MIKLLAVQNQLLANGHQLFLEQQPQHHVQPRIVFKQLLDLHAIIFQALMEPNTQFVIQ
jgi:hypothetical protein